MTMASLGGALALASNEWCLGSVTVPLDFLDAGRRYTAEIYRDRPIADYRTDARPSIAIAKRQARRR